DPRLRFLRLDMKNPLYNPGGSDVGPDALKTLGLEGFDAACMFSVITHQNPEDAATILRMLWQCVLPQGQLYFTAFIDEAGEAFAERDPSHPGAGCNYNPDYLIGLAGNAGWAVQKIYAASELHQPAFVCERN